VNRILDPLGPLALGSVQRDAPRDRVREMGVGGLRNYAAHVPLYIHLPSSPQHHLIYKH
jgi:hypothetical protein